MNPVTSNVSAMNFHTKPQGEDSAKHLYKSVPENQARKMLNRKVFANMLSQNRAKEQQTDLFDNVPPNIQIVNNAQGGKKGLINLMTIGHDSRSQSRFKDRRDSAEGGSIRSSSRLEPMKEARMQRALQVL